ncbi:radical SAM protein [Aminobacter sp. BA135]|uniref:radical SAM protein n=1 Tax=Aminobacter sp. BA135 TaxID=537596 RepID=UPI003D7BC365
MSIALTNACELACPYCYAAKAPARNRADQVLEWTRELDIGGGLGVGFGGGEPSLFPGFADLCQQVHAGTGLAVTFTTHGHRFRPDLVSQLSGAVDFIRLSMDGIGPTYERLRGRSFAEFREKLVLVRETASFGINMVLNADTIGDLAHAATFAFSEGARELLLLPETEPDGRLSCDGATLERAAEWITANHEHVRLATSDHAVEALGVPRLPTAGADPSLDFMHIDAFGMLKFGAFERHGAKLEQGAALLPAIEALRAKRSAT